MQPDALQNRGAGRLRILAILVCISFGALHAAPAEVTRPLTAQDAIETVRIMSNPGAVNTANPDGAVSISPDGTRYVVRLVRGDVQRNGVWMDLITARLTSLDEAVRHETAARLFTTGLGGGAKFFGPHRDTSDHENPIHWLDDENIAFLWSDERNIRQVVQVNLAAKQLRYLTRHPSHVASFDISTRGAALYVAQAPDDAEAAANQVERGFVVPENADAYAILAGDPQGGTLLDRGWRTQWFLQDRAGAPPRPLTIGGRDVSADYRHRFHFSPDGTRALVNVNAGLIPASWSRYTDRDMLRWIESARDASSDMSRNAHQLWVVDLRDGTSRPLWDAVSLIYLASVAWSPDGKFVLLAPTYLPPEHADSPGLEGRAAAVVDVTTGDYERLPIELARASVDGLRWIGDHQVEIAGRKGKERRLHRFMRRGSTWSTISDGSAGEEVRHGRVRVELREDLDTPPRLFAVDRVTGHERMILDPNPWLVETFDLGRVEERQGDSADGSTWSGLLFYPVQYEPGKHYPLVIQSTYGRGAGTIFTLYGYGSLGPTPVAACPGRVLASRGMFVMHLNVDMQHTFGTAMEAETRRLAFEAVSEQLTAAGLVDETKVGLIGFSRNGYWVQYTLTHSDFPFAAAIDADSWDPSYFQTTLIGHLSESRIVNGAAPFGANLKSWLEKAPGFNLERMRTPLRIVQQSIGLFGVVAKWETLSRMRYLKKPVELYVMPQVERHGAHSSQNPAQILAVQQGSVDWFDFWLNGYEDPSPQKRRQYERWRRLRALHEADLRQPRPPRLEWQATPIREN